MRKFKKLLMLGLIFALIIQSLPVCAETYLFSDLSEDHWAYDSIQYVVGKGYMGETNDGLFEPETIASRAMMITALYRSAGEPSVNASTKPFPDVELGVWYSEPIIWAKSIGIIDGHDDGNFRPNDNMPREQIALIMWRYAESLGYNMITVGSDYDQFEDFNNTPYGCRQAMKWAIRRDMLIGRQDGKLYPNLGATRAELATCLRRFETTNQPAYYPQVVQAETNWCWAACAEMAGKNVYPASSRTQASVVEYVFGTQVNETGSRIQGAQGSQYVADNRKSFSYVDARWSYSQIVEAINKGYVVQASVGYYDETGTRRLGGHRLIIYATSFGSTLSYYDPGDGTTDTCTYSEFCYGGYASNAKFDGVVYVVV